MASKVPAVTLGFWVIKILATTLGETGGDAVSMSWLGETTPDAGSNGLNGYLVGTTMFGLLLAVLIAIQIARAVSTRGSTGRRLLPRPGRDAKAQFLRHVKSP